jgi:hypothetical protein
MATEYIKYVAIVEVKMDKNRVSEINSWNKEDDWGDNQFTPESHIASIIKDRVEDTGYPCKVKVYEHNMYERLNENAEDYLIRDAREEIENEILTQHCVGGNCED